MNELRPKLFDVMKSYTKKQLIKDIISGIIVAIIALPLSIALAIASGVGPEQGLYTAIIAGFFISFFGGSRVQIGGPTAAFVVIIYGIVASYGTDGLIVATILAGIILVIMGICRFGSLIKYIPYTITTGFTCGIAVTLFIGQLKDFFGMDIASVPSEFLDKVIVYAKNISTINLTATLIGLLAVAIMLLWTKVTDKIPGSLVAIVVTTAIAYFAKLPVNTIGSVYGKLNSAFPSFHVPSITMNLIQQMISPAFTIAVLAAIESLLSAVVSDGMIGDTHKSNAELIGQGLGNIFSGFFGGIPATGAIARTAANVRNGGRTPIAGIAHCITLTIILLVLMPLAALIPMTTLAAVLLVVAANMADWSSFFRLCKNAPKSDIIVLVATFFLTVFFDLVVAIEIGVVLAALLFMKRMAETADIKAWKYTDSPDITPGEAEKLREIPHSISVFEICGPMFFAAADQLLGINSDHRTKAVVIRMRSVPAIDASAMKCLHELAERAKKKNIHLIFSHVNEQPMKVMKKDGFYELIGKKNFHENIVSALDYAETLVK
ncbi:STAS domain-containing protein [Coprococcus comes]|mgnify:FL=1|jgi:SulP family sulfate permease|uniref:SulP family inorganic anion transporter n=1 Tax=Coprococcus comes TaxID=410072 RepID=UPI00156DB9F3|nr:SulP family inorganic anion transporter [Coprococcus comes]MBT9751687.1 STAS domain-containing protein [Coprococcus comes]MBT9781881.1 STAS domain-containing protein [Coprococcus comes]NSC78784.1 STAS domain-containing protein [Coprococcus comes]NSE65744.1 STAS domain-containing protein [Coprococcus comes]NSE68704.1 STAS domain-containing protein [Coprococcus comes]